MSAKGGITKGKSHAEGGIPMQVKSTGQMVELEGGEGVINKKNMADTTKHEFEGKMLTKCEIASEINSDGGNGVKIDCDDVTGKKYKHAEGGEISENDSNEELREFYKKEYGEDFEVKPLKKEEEPSQEEFQKVWNRFKKNTARRFGGGTYKDKFRGTIDDEIEKMERGGNVATILNDYKNRGKRKIKMQEFENGGILKDGLRKKENIAFIFKVGGTYDAFNSKTYEDVGSYTFLPNQFYVMKFYMFDKENMEVYLEVAEGETIVVNRDDIRIDGYDIPDSIKGDEINDLMFAEEYENLNEIDKEILEMLVRRKGSLTTDQINFISYFKGHNVVNSLSNEIIEQMYSLIFEYKAGDMSIEQIFIYNNGNGRLLSLAPQYAFTGVLNNTKVGFAQNGVSFATIEMQINNALNGYKESVNWEYIDETDDIYLVQDALLYVRKETNPKGFPEIQHFTDVDSIKQISVCLGEFTSFNLLNEYIKNQQEAIDNKFVGVKTKNKHIVIQKGITEKGTLSLFSIITKGY